MPYIVENEDSLIAQLQLSFPEASRNSIKQWIEHGRISVNKKIVKKANTTLKKGDRFDLLPKKEKLLDENLEILFEDDQLVVINKPEGLLSVAQDIETEISVHRLLKQRRRPNNVFPVHRIDRETSGVLVFAYTEESRRHFKELFFHHDIQREYLAVVEGEMQEKEGTWTSFLVEDEIGYVHNTKEIMLDARKAITHFKTLKKGKNCSLISLKLETGRKNQIRVHAAKAKHPILGDKKYKASLDPYKRLMLHAYLLGFIHPTTKKNMVFKVEPPKIFQKVY